MSVGVWEAGRATVREKARLARGHGLAGVFVWEAGQDLPPASKASLLRALAQERRRILGTRAPADDAGRRALKRAAAKARAGPRAAAGSGRAGGAAAVDDGGEL